MVSFHKVNSEAEHDTEMLSSPNGMFLSLVSEYNGRFLNSVFFVPNYDLYKSGLS